MSQEHLGAAAVEPAASSNALADAARAVAVKRLGRARLPVEVVVRLNDQLEVEDVRVELLTAAVADELPGECFRDIVTLLARKGQRLTTSQVIAGLIAQDTPHGEGPIKVTLATAVRDDLLTSKPQGKPPGYGLPSWS